MGPKDFAGFLLDALEIAIADESGAFAVKINTLRERADDLGIDGLGGHPRKRKRRIIRESKRRRCA